jgi:hypothetical protein
LQAFRRSRFWSFGRLPHAWLKSAYDPDSDIAAARIDRFLSRVCLLGGGERVHRHLGAGVRDQEPAVLLGAVCRDGIVLGLQYRLLPHIFASPPQAGRRYDNTLRQICLTRM